MTMRQRTVDGDATEDCRWQCSRRSGKSKGFGDFDLGKKTMGFGEIFRGKNKGFRETDLGIKNKGSRWR